MTFAPESTALVLVEFQRQWTDPGLYRWMISRQLDGRSVIAATAGLVREARAVGVTIVHAPLVIDPQRKRGWLARVTFGRVFRLGSDKALLTDGLHEPADLVVTGRYAFDAFKGSDLEALLNSRGIESVLVAGFTTDQCVAKTAKTADKLGFTTYLLTDCTASMTRMHQRSVERKFGDRALSNDETRALLGAGSHA